MTNTIILNECPICAEKNPAAFKIYFDGYLKLYRCFSCGFVAQYPGQGEYSFPIYEDAYSLDFLKKNQKFMYPQRGRAFQDIVDRLNKIEPNSRILDIGCGDGHFLHLCKQKGFKCTGVEGSKNLSSYASSVTKSKIIQGLYNKDMFPENSFDIITLIQVLEHISEPRKVLEIVKYHLRPKGILAIEVPSIHAPHFLLYRLTGLKYFVKPPHGIISPHVGYYSPKTFLRLTNDLQFKTVSLTTGRWKHKYSGYLKLIANITDPILNNLRMGGILYIGRN